MKSIYAIVCFFLFAIGSVHAQSWAFEQKIFPDDPNLEPQDNITNAIALSDNYMLVGAHFHNYDSAGLNRIFSAGAVYAYTKDSNGEWQLTQKIVAEERNGAAFFGNKISMDGNWAAFASGWEPVDSVPGRNAVGAVHLYQLDAQGYWRYDTSLISPEPRPSGHYGSDVAIENGKLIVGAYGDRFNTSMSDSLLEAGAAFYYEYESGTGWVFKQKLVASDRKEEAWFGYEVELDGDFAFIGATLHAIDITTRAGQVYVFEWNASNSEWEESQIIQDNDPFFQERYGENIAAADPYLFLGLPNEDDMPDGSRLVQAGVVNVYKRDMSGQYQLVQELTASDKAFRGYFGKVATDGTTLAVGATGESFGPSKTDSIFSAGAVYLFELNANEAWKQVEKIIAPERSRFDMFGDVIAVNGQEMLVGVPKAENDSVNYDQGKGFIFRRAWALDIGHDLQTPLVALAANPSQELQLIQLSEQPQKLTIRLYSLDGKVVVKGSSQEALIELESAYLPNGLYVVQIQDDRGGTYSLKWLKK